MRLPRRRLQLWAALGILLLAGTLAILLARTHEEVAAGHCLLAEGRPAAAAARFERGHDWPWLDQEARAGAALSGVLQGAAALPSPRIDAARRHFDLPALAAMALQAANWRAVLALAAALPGDPRVAALAAAAELELGQDDAARARLARYPAAAALAIGVRQVLGARSAGAHTLLRDRRGVLLGWFDGAGQVVIQSSEIAALLPIEALSRLELTGPAVRLTLDLALSRLALRALGPHHGSIVLADPVTGGILAAVSDAGTHAREGGVPAFEQRREPASISKLITATAALRAGIDVEAAIAQMTCNQHQRYGMRTLWCSFKAGPLSGPAHALAISCNIAFANLGESVGLEALAAELRRFGFDRPDGLIRWGRVLRAEPALLPDLSIGLEASDITPAHAALVGAAFVAGQLHEPKLVLADDSPAGLVQRARATAPAEGVVEAQWLPLLWHAMEAVTAAGGTAAFLDSGFPVVMKTGTAATPGLGYHVNYIGAGPLPRPRIAFAVRVTGLFSSHRVNVAARDVTATLFEGLAAARLP